MRIHSKCLKQLGPHCGESNIAWSSRKSNLKSKVAFARSRSWPPFFVVRIGQTKIRIKVFAACTDGRLRRGVRRIWCFATGLASLNDAAPTLWQDYQRDQNQSNENVQFGYLLGISLEAGIRQNKSVSGKVVRF